MDLVSCATWRKTPLNDYKKPRLKQLTGEIDQIRHVGS
jgi:hypothetical protein